MTLFIWGTLTLVLMTAQEIVKMGRPNWRDMLTEDYEDEFEKVERIPHPRKTEEEKKGIKKGQTFQKKTEE